MKNQLSDYCKNCKKYSNTCEGCACSCKEYDPIIQNKYAPKNK